jgi:hypothetical protein
MRIHKTKKETVTAAVGKVIARRKQLEIVSLFGTIDFDPNYDYKQERRAKRPTILKAKARSGVLR